MFRALKQVAATTATAFALTLMAAAPGAYASAPLNDSDHQFCSVLTVYTDRGWEDRITVSEHRIHEFDKMADMFDTARAEGWYERKMGIWEPGRQDCLWVNPMAKWTIQEFWDEYKAAFKAQPKATTSATGTARVGSTLSAKFASKAIPKQALKFAWLRDGKAIKGASKATYKLTASDAGHKVSVKITRSAYNYKPVTTASKAVKVAAGASKAGKVAVSGTAKVAKKVTARATGWASGTRLSYQWLRNGKSIKGATKASYTLTRADKGKKISVKVTGKRAGYTTVARTSGAKKVS
ncbi:hypothetical protein DWB68_03990 [Galactobacter valiniphilus]|uniref:Uncharacterized protein n=1 Tax=Galactobacter valiniphilus TaxID=2676122 RepID=A0A399JFP8_9MICC|nr:hypothetical protein [Galactobacter valiniphilus]RII42952.1 hypothetical protein DWB68_03990 [Galactobacter valiniphilus]